MEAEVIRSFLTDLVTAVSDCVLAVSDQCLASGLIPDSVYKRILESGGTSEDKARTLILAVKRSTETDSICFGILLNILERQLPYASRVRLLSEIRKELIERANSHREVVPSYEGLRRKHEHASTQNNALLEMLKAKFTECARLTDELEALKKQVWEATASANARGRITACEHEISALKLRVEELEGTPEGQNRQASGSLSSKVEELAQQLKKAIEEIKDIKEIFQQERQKQDHSSSENDKAARKMDTKLDLQVHFEVCNYLRLLNNQQVCRVGGALGLAYDNLQKMKVFPDEMVAAWLRREDYVLTKSGEPTWRSLIQALKKAGQEGVANDIEETEIK